jgi:TIR domain
MTDRIDRDQPLVFLSFAGPDRPKAERLRGDLKAQGFDAFVDEHCITPGEDILNALSKALTRSSYCVLLWSRHTQDRPWVEFEWTVALTRELDERRSFLFVVRLDETAVPLLLATRKYLDAFVDWDKAVARLVATWSRDRKAGTPVLPAPNPVAAGWSGGADLMELYVRNRALSVSHVVLAPSNVTGSELLDLVRKSLDLRDSESKYNGLVSAHFAYEFTYRDKALADGPLTELGIGDGDTVDLVVHGEFVSYGQTVATWTFRDASAPRQPAVNQRVVRALVDAAFRHLMP